MIGKLPLERHQSALPFLNATAGAGVNSFADAAETIDVDLFAAAAAAAAYCTWE